MRETVRRSSATGETVTVRGKNERTTYCQNESYEHRHTTFAKNGFVFLFASAKPSTTKNGSVEGHTYVSQTCMHPQISFL